LAQIELAIPMKSHCEGFTPQKMLSLAFSSSTRGLT
jgi:hypothetical protein